MALSPFSLGFWGKTLLKEKRHFFYLFYDLMNLHKKFYTTAFSAIGSHATPKKDEIAEEVLNDMVFGYCVRLSESLFPMERHSCDNAP
jgi:hypothetical protein